MRPEFERLAGRVEADKVDVSGKEEGGKASVAVAVEEEGSGMGRVRLKRVPHASAASEEAFLLGAVEPGKVIRTDGKPSYAPLRELGYRHDKAVTGGGSGPDRARLPSGSPGRRAAEEMAAGNSPKRGGE